MKTSVRGKMNFIVTGRITGDAPGDLGVPALQPAASTMTPELKSAFSRIMWSMTKQIQRGEGTFAELLDDLDVTWEEWDLIKEELKRAYNVETYT